MQVGLTQRDFAERLEVSVETVRNWELGHARPSLRNAPKVAQKQELYDKFLLADFPARLRAARVRLGLSQADFAAQIGVGKDTMTGWERGYHEPWARHRAEAEKLIEVALTEDERVALRVRAVREQLGITQRALAVWLGVHRKTVSKWERGRRRPSEEMLRRIEEIRP